MQHGKGRGGQRCPRHISLRHVCGCRERVVIDLDSIVVLKPGLVDGEDLDRFLCRWLGTRNR